LEVHQDDIVWIALLDLHHGFLAIVSNINLNLKNEIKLGELSGGMTMIVQ